METRVVAVMVVVEGDKATLVDREGVAFTAVPLDRLAGLPDPKAVAWSRWAGQQSFNGTYQTRMRQSDAWIRKADGLRLSWKCRARYMVRTWKDEERNHSGVNKCSAGNWLDCADRMSVLMQRRKQKQIGTTGWTKWADTCSRNQNRRARELYGND